MGVVPMREKRSWISLIAMLSAFFILLLASMCNAGALWKANGVLLRGNLSDTETDCNGLFVKPKSAAPCTCWRYRLKY